MGGGARGFSVIPIFREFEKNNLKFDYVSGTSVGAIIGAYYCLNLEINTLVKKLESMSKKDWAMLIDFNNPKKSIIKGEKIKKFLEENFFQDKTFHDLKIPLIITTTNISKNKIEYISEGLLIDAIMCSISLPGLFKPYYYKNNYYLDGGIKDNLPIEVLLLKKMNKVIAIDFSLDKSKNIRYDNIFDVLLNTFSSLLDNSKKEYTLDNRIYTFRPQFDGYLMDILKFYNVKENINYGEKVIVKEEEKFSKWLK